MKTFNRVFSGLILAFCMMGCVSLASAVNPVVSPKNTYETSYVTGLNLVTPAVVTTTTTANAQFQPGAVYQVVLGTGASGDYFQMYDSTATAGITCGQYATLPGNAVLLGPKLFFGSTTANTATRLDPPWQFFNGLAVCVSSTADSAAISYELGRGLSGQ